MTEERKGWHRHANGGGWVEDTASVAETVRVGPRASVYGHARVAGEAQVYGEAQVSGRARVFGNAVVGGDARVSGEARVAGNAVVGGDALVSGQAAVFGHARVCGSASVAGSARVSGEAQVFGHAKVSGNAKVYGNARVSGRARVSGNAQVCEKVEVSGKAIVSGNASASVHEVSGEPAAVVPHPLARPGISGKLHSNGGGWVEDTAEVSATAFVDETSAVYDQARVFGSSTLKDAVLNGSAHVHDGQITGSCLYEDSQVRGGSVTSCSLWEFAKIEGSAKDLTILGNGWVPTGHHVDDCTQMLPGSHERLGILRGSLPSYTVKGYHRHSNGGGLVEDTAYVDGSAYIGPNAVVHDYARVLGSARVEDHARVSGISHVNEKAIVAGHARVTSNSRVSGQVRGRAQVWGSIIDSEVSISGQAQVAHSTLRSAGIPITVTGNAVLCNALLKGGGVVKDHGFVTGHLPGRGMVVEGADAYIRGEYHYFRKPDDDTMQRVAHTSGRTWINTATHEFFEDTSNLKPEVRVRSELRDLLGETSGYSPRWEAEGLETPPSVETSMALDMESSEVCPPAEGSSIVATLVTSATHAVLERVGLPSSALLLTPEGRDSATSNAVSSWVQQLRES